MTQLKNNEENMLFSVKIFSKYILYLKKDFPIR